ncbi:MAG TPA: ABC transporter substrate-binding protein [Gemmatimonadales bacterium]|nr:ABC transporter substrate-binding protein [Gemmatimonadales bacterium]
MKRRHLIRSLTAILAGWPMRAFAQRPGKLPQVGVLVSASPPHPFADALRRGLQTFGYTDGRNITLDVRYTQGRSDRAAALAAELVRAGIDMIVAHFTPATRAAIAATRTIPIIMAPAGAPLQTGFIQSLARPGGNVTGLSGMDAEMGGKRLQLLRQLIPNLRCVAVLGSTPATDPFSGPFVEDLRSAAVKAGLRLEPVLVDGPGAFPGAFTAMVKAKAQAFVVQGLFDPHRAALIELAAKHRLAYMSNTRESAVAGALIAVSANYETLYERAAYYVDRIIKGANPATLPVEQPAQFQVVINARTARALGLMLSPELLSQVDEVIE